MWPYKRGASGLTRGGQFTISVNQKSGLIIGVAFGECGLIIGVAFVEWPDNRGGLIIGVTFGECGLIRGVQVVTLQEDSLLVVYYLSESEIWPDN